MKRLKIGITVMAAIMFFASAFPSFAKPVGAGDFSVSASLSADRRTVTYNIKTNTSELVDFATVGFYIGQKDEPSLDMLDTSYSNIEGDYESYDSEVAYVRTAYFDNFKGSVTLTQTFAKPLPDDMQTVYYGLGNIDDNFDTRTKDSYFTIFNVFQGSFNLTDAGVTEVLGNVMPAFTGVWRKGVSKDAWWYDNQDGSYLKDGWHWVDGNNDGVAECYYFDNSGWILANTKTPDGYDVNTDGAWVVNGMVQTKSVPATNHQVQNTTVKKQ